MSKKKEYLGYDYRERQKELGRYECGSCPRCNSKLHRCPFCGEKLCVKCGWDEEAPTITIQAKEVVQSGNK